MGIEMLHNLSYTRRFVDPSQHVYVSRKAFCGEICPNNYYARI